jgi:hypothetical protein
MHLIVDENFTMSDQPSLVLRHTSTTTPHFAFPRAQFLFPSMGYANVKAVPANVAICCAHTHELERVEVDSSLECQSVEWLCAFTMLGLGCVVAFSR